MHTHISPRHIGSLRQDVKSIDRKVSIVGIESSSGGGGSSIRRAPSASIHRNVDDRWCGRKVANGCDQFPNSVKIAIAPADASTSSEGFGSSLPSPLVWLATVNKRSQIHHCALGREELETIGHPLPLPRDHLSASAQDTRFAAFGGIILHILGTGPMQTHDVPGELDGLSVQASPNEGGKDKIRTGIVLNLLHSHALEEFQGPVSRR
mmetsp:Transcript_10398/g.29233  ORF Transcript_10398/g.29233 Transcript_10398/m.29233 type:complete len:208 (-) Transcript_10398:2198-2821(-)